MVTVSSATRDQLVRLGGRLKSARMSRGMTMAAFAQSLNISVAALKRMELGRSGVSIGRWAEVLRCLSGPEEVEQLLPGQGPQTPYKHQNHPRGIRQRTV